ncbi:Arm DNA-binding domain-containing protein [Hoeflea alexandrii]|uniref:Arm DNA-binding domain-containing protein n=1 Tax=Hoeflea alexandrii TaxID=288436 RepID=UPI003D2F919E
MGGLWVKGHSFREKGLFVLQYRIGRRSRRITLGTFGALTADQARSHAQAALRQIARGDDPMAERDLKRAEKGAG